MRPIHALLLGLAVLAAGCTGVDEAGSPTTTTPATTTRPPTTTTPTVPTAPTPNGTAGNESMEFLDCDEPSPQNATLGEAMGYPEAVFTVREAEGADECYGFVGPASVPAGWTAVTLRNDGGELHIMPMYRVDADWTRDDAAAALQGNASEGHLEPVGGVGVATPGASGTSLLDLREGKYLIVCFVEGHHARGMFRLLDVTPATGTPRPAPQPNATIVLRDFEFDVPTLPAGRHVVAFENRGNQTHEAPLIRLAGNATMQEFVAAVMDPANATGPPPGEGVGGVNELAPGGTAYAIIDLTPGRYGLVCFVMDPATGKPHVDLGMMTEFTVA